MYVPAGLLLPDGAALIRPRRVTRRLTSRRPGKQQRRRAIYQTPCWSCCRVAASPDPALENPRQRVTFRTATAYPPVEYRSRASRLPAS
ncbi:hypothetical protein IE993_25420 [Klebsiella pneumoniae]|uniref:Uncharacterized protein n=1 Tax=Klebsiella pneumoniae TaxID=573 RepID=A0A927DGD9_KLEPN|nr:hypothetical protein [Klebsiella pneumoniae]MBD3706240.1 hypothetical protein [Klebsiella pneumoniae]